VSPRSLRLSVPGALIFNNRRRMKIILDPVGLNESSVDHLAQATGEIRTACQINDAHQEGSLTPARCTVLVLRCEELRAARTPDEGATNYNNIGCYSADPKSVYFDVARCRRWLILVDRRLQGRDHKTITRVRWRQPRAAVH
jgi:hypothetical protein